MGNLPGVNIFEEIEALDMTAWRILTAPMALLGTLVASASALADHGMAHPWQLGLQPPVTPVAVALNDFHNLLLVIITVITVFVTLLLIVVFL